MQDATNNPVTSSKDQKHEPFICPCEACEREAKRQEDAAEDARWLERAVARWDLGTGI